MDLNEALKTLKLLRCKRHYNNNEVLEYHTCLNIIEDYLCENNCVILDLSTFDSNSPEECYKVIHNSK